MKMYQKNQVSPRYGIHSIHIQKGEDLILMKKGHGRYFNSTTCKGFGRAIGSVRKRHIVLNGNLESGYWLMRKNSEQTGAVKYTVLNPYLNQTKGLICYTYIRFKTDIMHRNISSYKILSIMKLFLLIDGCVSNLYLSLDCNSIVFVFPMHNNIDLSL